MAEEKEKRGWFETPKNTRNGILASFWTNRSYAQRFLIALGTLFLLAGVAAALGWAFLPAGALAVAGGALAVAGTAIATFFSSVVFASTAGTVVFGLLTGGVGLIFGAIVNAVVQNKLEKNGYHAGAGFDRHVLASNNMIITPELAQNAIEEGLVEKKFVATVTLDANHNINITTDVGKVADVKKFLDDNKIPCDVNDNIITINFKRYGEEIQKAFTKENVSLEKDKVKVNLSDLGETQLGHIHPIGPLKTPKELAVLVPKREINKFKEVCNR